MRPVCFGFATVVAVVAGVVGTAQAQSHVTCVGDSITFGDGTSAPAKAYPAVLQGLLGAGYAVENDGQSGATMLKSGDLPYWTTAKYGTSTTWAMAGGDVVIQLGTNDSKPKNWLNKASFLGDCEALVDHYRATSPSARVWINLIPPATSGACCKISGTTIENEIIPLLQQCATNKTATVIDVHAALMPFTSWLTDGVHPNDQGAALIAQTVYNALAKVPSITLSAGPPASAAPASVALTAAPIAAYGKVERVRFYKGPTLLQEVTAAPWTTTAANLAAGSHSFTAVVVESAGRTQTSSPATVVVDAAPPPPPADAGQGDAAADASDASSGGVADAAATDAAGSSGSSGTASSSGSSGASSSSGASGASSSSGASGASGASGGATPEGNTAPADDAPASSSAEGGCSSSPGTHDTSPFFLTALAAALGVIARRRRR